MDYEASKTFTIFGKNYKPGDPFDETTILPNKLSQLLNQRYLRPSIPHKKAPDSKQE
jgi:hypothetical protein